MNMAKKTVTKRNSCSCCLHLGEGALSRESCQSFVEELFRYIILVHLLISKNGFRTFSYLPSLLFDRRHSFTGTEIWVFCSLSGPNDSACRIYNRRYHKRRAQLTQDRSAQQKCFRNEGFYLYILGIKSTIRMRLDAIEPISLLVKGQLSHK